MQVAVTHAAVQDIDLHVPWSGCAAFERPGFKWGGCGEGGVGFDG